MKIITFSGVDGSGKSTQATLLKNHLEATGKNVQYFHATEFSLANRIVRKLKGQKGPFVPGAEKAVVQAFFSTILVRLMFLLFDAVRFERYRVKLAGDGVDYLVSDRFFQDSLINILYLSQNPVVEKLAKSLAEILPVPDTCFYLKVTPEEVLARTRVPEQGLDYLKEKMELYNDTPFVWSRKIVVGNQMPETLHEEIKQTL